MLLSFQATGQPPAVSVCPTRTIPPNVTGRINSPGFSDDYGANLNCKLTLKVPLNKELQVTYSYVDIECKYIVLREGRQCYHAMAVLMVLCTETNLPCSLSR